MRNCRIAEGGSPALVVEGALRAEGCTFAGAEAVRTWTGAVLDLSDCDLLAGGAALTMHGGKARLVSCRLTSEGRLALHGLGEARAFLDRCRLQARDTSIYWESRGRAKARDCVLEAAGAPLAEDEAMLELVGCEMA